MTTTPKPKPEQKCNPSCKWCGGTGKERMIFTCLGNKEQKPGPLVTCREIIIRRLENSKKAKTA